ncbi:hypothetical protein ACFT2C_12590 [Promicromonospora sp. NPDC057138]|uniref:hypothetical protein n=1 Tax=Promicromonospora sp. NPDC057138 TaxID=3346031 RepID=UPI00362B1F97
MSHGMQRPGAARAAARHPKGAPNSSGGRFAPSPHDENATALSPIAPPKVRPSRQTTEFIERMVQTGYLSPGARAMDPREAIEQHAEASVMLFVQKVSWYEQAGLYMRADAEDIREGDRIDVEPLMREYSKDALEGDAKPSISELATVIQHDDIMVDGRRVTSIHTDQAHIQVPLGTQVEFMPAPDNANRCDDCGDEMDDAEEDYLCSFCAADQRAEEAAILAEASDDGDGAW